MQLKEIDKISKTKKQNFFKGKFYYVYFQVLCYGHIQYSSDFLELGAFLPVKKKHATARAINCQEKTHELVLKCNNRSGCLQN